MTTTYYTPKVEEFHIGFEFESYSDVYGWKESRITFPHIPFIQQAKLGEFSTPEWIRVKHLDREDAESLGWEHDYNLEPIPNRETDPTFEGYSIEDANKIFMLYLFNDGEVWIELVIGNAGHGFIFKGKLQNKSELRRLMIQLGIIDNE
jgi:hypothetical protein